MFSCLDFGWRKNTLFRLSGSVFLAHSHHAQVFLFNMHIFSFYDICYIFFICFTILCIIIYGVFHQITYLLDPLQFRIRTTSSSSKFASISSLNCLHYLDFTVIVIVSSVSRIPAHENYNQGMRKKKRRQLILIKGMRPILRKRDSYNENN